MEVQAHVCDAKNSKMYKPHGLKMSQVKSDGKDNLDSNN